MAERPTTSERQERQTNIDGSDKRAGFICHMSYARLFRVRQLGVVNRCYDYFGSGFDAGLDLQPTPHRLVVVENYSPSLQTRFDFHIYGFLSMK
jgi:hypothetical protein